MSREDTANRLVDDLQSLLTGGFSELEFRTKYPAASAAPDLPNEIWASLEHYLTDADIRNRDARYRALQDAEMEKLIGLLRVGGSDSELIKVTFLSTS